MAADYTTLQMSGHIAGRASEKKLVAWRVIAEIIAYAVEGEVTKAEKDLVIKRLLPC
jgi:hypothetical protein